MDPAGIVTAGTKQLQLGALPGPHQFEHWRERMHHMIDVTPFGQDVAQGFDAAITVYQVGEVVISRCASDAVVLQRSLSRISTDAVRHYMFQIFLDGDAGHFSSPGHALGARRGDIVVLDFNEPVTMRRGRYDSLNLFVPRHIVDPWVARGTSLHCALAPGDSPLACVAKEALTSFMRFLPGMTEPQAQAALAPLIQLLTAAVNANANADQSAARAVVASFATSATLARARQYVEDHLEDTGLNADVIARGMGISRASLYRMFEPYGGVSAYILRIRLRHAAAELVRRPHTGIAELAYGLGFGSPSDFSRAFRRVYGRSPRELREQRVPGVAGRQRRAGLHGPTRNQPYWDWFHEAARGV